MRIAFITDLHLGGADEKPQGVDVRQNFLKALDFLTELKPNALVLGGDLCNASGNRAIYQWIKAQVDRLPFPCYVIAGNHDDSVMMAEVFKFTHYLHQTELYFALPLAGRPTLFLDSSKGILSSEQWAWLHEYMDALRDSSVLVFMHHPPMPADVTFMDRKYPFRESEEFLELVRNRSCHVTVVCGHYHVEKVVQRGNLTTLLTPSTFWQLEQESPEFAINNYRIGIREINLTTHGTNSTVHYL